MSKQIIKQLSDNGLGCHSINTLVYYCKLIEKYNALRQINTNHIDACEMIGISEKHLYFIRRVVNKIN